VRIAIDRRAVRLAVENDRAPGDGAAAFSPRSLTRRASAMGGRAVVAIAEGRTVVNVEIPL
jgi:signal transduction histidine kinase